MRASDVREETACFMRNFVVRDGVDLTERMKQLRAELHQTEDLAEALAEKRAVHEMREFLGCGQDVLPQRAREVMAQNLADAIERAAKLRRILRIVERMAGEPEITFIFNGEAK